MKTSNLSTAWQMTLMIMLSVIVVMLPDMAFAAVATPIGNAMCTVAAWFLGNTGQGLATLAIIVGLGIALIFGAAAMVDAINAGGSGCDNLP